MRLRCRLTALVAIVLAGAGCGSRELLTAYPAEAPAGVIFAGHWALNEDPAAIARRLNRAIRETAGIRRDVLVPGPRDQRGGQRASGGLAHVFLENGARLQITQTPSGIFISFDRAVVEEYRFGENREINVGQVEAQRVSGWQGRDYVIETLGRNGMKLTERLSLSGDGNTLSRTITFRSRSLEEMTVVETFSRQF